LRAQTMKAAPHVGDTSGNPDPRARAQFHHGRRLAITALSSAAFTPFSTRIVARPGSSMWIEPVAVCTCADGAAVRSTRPASIAPLLASAVHSASIPASGTDTMTGSS
jgi:hypothetical protein